MAELQPTDLFLVNRSNTVSTVTSENLMATILDDDLLLVNRGDVASTITGADVKESLGSKPIFPEADEITSSPAFQGGTGTEVDPFLLQTVDARPGGAVAVSVEQITITVAGATEGDLVVWTDNSTGAGTRFAQPTGVVLADGNWTGRLVYEDSPATTVDTDYIGNLQIGNVYFRWVVEQGIDPIRPINPSPDEITASPDFQSGSGTAGDPYILETQTCAPAGSNISSAEEITIAEPDAAAGELVRWTADNTRFTQPEGVTDSNGVWTGRLVYNDTPDTTTDQTYVGNLYIGSTYFRWSVDQRVLATQAPIVNGVSLVETNPAEGDRFTSQSFVVQGTMTTDGIPTSTKTIAAHVDGSLTVSTETDPIQSVGTTPGPDYSDLATLNPGLGNSWMPGPTAAPAFDGNLSTLLSTDTNTTIQQELWRFTITQEIANNWNKASAVTFYNVPGNGTAGSSSCGVWRNGSTLLNDTQFTPTVPMNLYNLGGPVRDWVAGDYLFITNATSVAGNGPCYGISHTINGVETFLVDGQLVPQLVFTGNKDLDVLEAGDTVTTPIVQFAEPLESQSISTDYLAVTSFTLAADSLTTPERAKFFDGNPDTFMTSLAGAWTGGNGIIDIQLPVAITGVEKIMFSVDKVAVDGGLLTPNFIYNGTSQGSVISMPRVDEGTTYLTTFTPGNAALSQIGLNLVLNATISTDWKSINGFKVFKTDGTSFWLTSGQPELTFPANAEMATLEAGDVVSQTVNFTEPLESTTAPPNQPDYPDATLLPGSAVNFTAAEYLAALDGSTSTRVISTGTGSGNQISIDVSNIPLKGKKVEMWVDNSAQPADSMRPRWLTKSGAYLNTGATPSGANWVTLVPVTDSSQTVFSEDCEWLAMMGYGSTGAGRAWFSAFRVDGKLFGRGLPGLGPDSLVFPAATDMAALAPGDDVSQPGTPVNWFSDSTITEGVALGKTYNMNPPSAMFDGDFSTSPRKDGLISQGQSCGYYWTPPVPISNVTKLEIRITNGLSPTTVIVFGANKSNVNSLIGPNVWFDVTAYMLETFPDGTLEGMGWEFAASNFDVSGCPGIAAVRVNGVVLTDGVALPTTGTVGSITGTTATLTSSAGAWVNGVDVTTGDKTTSGTVGSITGTTATLSSSAGAWVNGIDVKGNEKAGSGTIGSLDPATNSMTLSSKSGPFLVGERCTGPQKTIENARLYCAFDSSGNVTDLQSTPQSPPYTTTDDPADLTLTFPATFPSGQTPDDELPEGTTLTVDFSASNASGTSGPVSATVQPEPGTPDVPLAGLTTLWSGNNQGTGDASRSIVNGINNQADGGLVWIKARSNDSWHWLYDTLRGPNSVMFTNRSGDEQPSPALTSFDTDGFTIFDKQANSVGENYVGWNFGKAEGYFDVVQYTGTGGQQVVSHGLATDVGMLIVKSLDEARIWQVYHKSLGSNSSLQLDSSSPAVSPVTSWGGTDPTDTEFFVGPAGSNNINTNELNKDYIAYLFAEDTPDVIKCGSYVGTEGTTPTIATGFKPQWVLIKCTDESSTNWSIFDSKRGTNKVLFPNESTDEQIGGPVNFVSNGFTVEGNDYATNASGKTYIYVAVAEPPITRTQTPEEFAETQLKTLTYDNRKQVKQGEEALDNREAVMKQAADLGLDISEVEKLLNPPAKKTRKAKK